MEAERDEGRETNLDFYVKDDKDLTKAFSALKSTEIKADWYEGEVGRSQPV